MSASVSTSAKRLSGPIAAFLALAALQACQAPETPMQPAGEPGLLATAVLSSPGTYTLTAVHSGKCVEVPNGSLADGAKLRQMPCDKSVKQQWKLRSPAAGVWEMVSAVSGKCADVAGKSTANGALIQQWTCYGTPNQRWTLSDKGNTQHQIRSLHSNRCVDVAGVSTADGAAIHQWDCHTGGNQKFAMAPVVIVPPTPVTACKRGIAYGHHSVADLTAMSKGIGWWYNWAATADPAVASSYVNMGVEFVPMVWGNGGFITNAEANIKPGAKYLLAFNEPNFHSQSNITAQQAAAEWPKIEAIANKYNLKIVSPATNFCGGGCNNTNPYNWLKDFFAACPNCRVDHIAAHWYACTGDALNYHLGNLKQFNRPIWLTEFSCLDGADKSVAAQKAYMKTALDILEADPMVFRYSWFSGRFADAPTINLLGASGQLTELGQQYVAHAQSCKQ
jgi:hypothetical protein